MQRDVAISPYLTHQAQAVDIYPTYICTCHVLISTEYLWLIRSWRGMATCSAVGEGTGKLVEAVTGKLVAVTCSVGVTEAIDRVLTISARNKNFHRN